MFKCFVKIKSLLLIILVFTITLSSYNSQRVYAFDARGYVIVAESVAVTATSVASAGATVAITPWVVGGLVIAAALYAGYKIATYNSNDVEDIVVNKAKSLSVSDANKYLYESDGKVGLTSDGYKWAKSVISDLDDNTPIDSDKVSDNTDSEIGLAYQYENYYMQPYSILTQGSVYTTFKVSAYDTVSICIRGRESSVHHTISATKGYDVFYRVVAYDDGAVSVKHSSDNVTWSNLIPLRGTDNYSDNYVRVRSSEVFIGYTTESGNVYPSDSLVIPIAPTTIPDGQTIAMPVVETEVDGVPVLDTKTQPATVYYDDVVIETLPKTDTDTDTDTDTGTDTNIDVNVDFDLDLDVPKNDIPNLDFTPLMIATRKFPFCIPWDMYKCFEVFEADPEPFKYEFKEVKYSNTNIVIIPNFSVDFSTIPHINILLSVLKTIQYLLFVAFLISKIRSFMRS